MIWNFQLTLAEEIETDKAVRIVCDADQPSNCADLSDEGKQRDKNIKNITSTYALMWRGCKQSSDVKDSQRGEKKNTIKHKKNKERRILNRLSLDRSDVSFLALIWWGRSRSHIVIVFFFLLFMIIAVPVDFCSCAYTHIILLLYLLLNKSNRTAFVHVVEREESCVTSNWIEFNSIPHFAFELCKSQRTRMRICVCFTEIYTNLFCSYSQTFFLI